jgi:serine/threonine protein kinase
VIHFDLKPGNIMVTADRRVKVLDVGLSGARAYHAGKGGIIGSPAYLAPELAMSADAVAVRLKPLVAPV